MSDKDLNVMVALYKLVNDCDTRTVPMGALYSELSHMLQHGITHERVSSILSQVHGKQI